MNEFVLNGLVKRRAQLAGDIENAHEALRKMVLDLERAKPFRSHRTLDMARRRDDGYRFPRGADARKRLRLIGVSFVR